MPYETKKNLCNISVSIIRIIFLLLKIIINRFVSLKIMFLTNTVEILDCPRPHKGMEL